MKKNVLTPNIKISAEERKAIGLKNYLKEMQRQESEKAADPEGYKARKAKRKEREEKRLARLAEKRKKRMEKLLIVELTQKQKTQKIIEDFKKAQLARKEKKEKKRAIYLTKGKIQVPKVKNKVEAQKGDTKGLPKSVKLELKTYIVIQSNFDSKKNIIDSKPIEIKCKPTNLSENLKKYHNSSMKKDPSNYIGTFAYPENDKDHCIYEMINSSYLAIDGVLTSRMAKNSSKKAA